MIKCDRCQQEFPFRWRLERHLARKNPCKKQNGENGHQGGENGHQGGENGHQGGEIGHQGGEIGHRCEFCFKELSSLVECRRHMLICKAQHDDVRQLEIKLGIPIPQYSNTMCRFCLCEFKTKLNRHQLTCIAKAEYKEKLEKQLEEKHARIAPQTINNTTNHNSTKIDDHSTNTTNNNITQYITVNPFGKENMEYITRAVILKLCRKSNFRDEIIPRLVKQVHCNPDHPENHNLLITNLRAAHGTVYDGENYIAETSKDIIDQVMDNVTDHLTTAAYTDNDDGKFNQYERAISRLEEDIGDEDSKFKREQRTKVRRNIYNNQKILQKTKRTVESQ